MITYEAHAQQIYRHRVLLQLIRENYALVPDFLAIAKRVKNGSHRGTIAHDFAITLSKVWRKRRYWDSDKAFHVTLKGNPVKELVPENVVESDWEV